MPPRASAADRSDCRAAFSGRDNAYRAAVAEQAACRPVTRMNVAGVSIRGREQNPLSSTTANEAVRNLQAVNVSRTRQGDIERHHARTQSQPAVQNAGIWRHDVVGTLRTENQCITFLSAQLAVGGKLFASTDREVQRSLSF